MLDSHLVNQLKLVALKSNEASVEATTPLRLELIALVLEEWTINAVKEVNFL